MDAPLTDPRPDTATSAAAAGANPPPPGPGFAPGNADRTAVQSDPGSVGGGTAARPERYLVIARHEGASADLAQGGGADGGTGSGADALRYLFARWADWPHPAMLSLSPPALEESLAEAVDRVIAARLGARTAAEPRLGATRVPARMPHPRTGIEGLGWLRPVAVRVTGEPMPDATLSGVALLTADEAQAALSTEVERIVFAAGVALFD